MTDWRTLAERSAASGMYETVHESVPDWLLDSMTAWVTPSFDWSSGNDLEGLRLFERRIRRQIPGSTGSEKWRALSNTFPNEPDLLLELIDFQLHRVSADEPYYQDDAAALDAILAEGGSAWTVAESDGAYALERRLGAVTAAAASGVMAVADRPSDHLKIAWTKAFGRSPDPSTSYLEAVKAVEAAVKPVISPNDEQATLGRMIGQMRAEVARYATVFDHERFSASEGVLAMMEVLWKSQHDRHGTDNEDTPIHVDQPAAEAAVHLAVTLVEWFRSEAVLRGP